MKKLILPLFVLLLLSFVYASPIERTGYVTYYNFSDAKDMYGNNNGSLETGAVIVSAGYIGPGLYLDNLNGYFNISNFNFFKNDSQDRFFINLWIKPNKVDSSANDRIFKVSNTTGSTIMEINVGTSINETQYTIIGATQRLKQGVIAQGSWEMMTFIRNGSQMITYKNGLEINRTSHTRTPFQNINNITIGFWDSGNSLNATYDEFIYATEVPTPSQVYGYYLNYTAGYTPFNSTADTVPVYYFENNGSDTTGDGSQANPYKTIKKRNTLGSGFESVFLSPVYLDEDEYPTLNDGDIFNIGTFYGGQRAYAGNFTESPANYWSMTVPDDYYMPFFDGMTIPGLRNWTISTLNQQGHFIQRGRNLTIYSVGNPVTYYGDVFLSRKEELFYAFSKDGIKLRNMTLIGGSEVSINIGGDSDDIEISGNIGLLVGGGNYSESLHQFMGNFIQLWGAGDNVLVENNIGIDILDACLTFQYGSTQPDITGSNITFRNNVCYGSGYGWEFWQDDVGSSFTNITLGHNSFIKNDAGIFKYMRQQSGQTIGERCFRYGGINNTLNIDVTNNICVGAEEYVIGSPYGIEALAAGNSTYHSDNNNFFGDVSTLIRWKPDNSSSATNYATLSSFSLATGLDTNSISENTLFVSEETYDFRPLLGEEVCTASSTDSYIGALPCAVGLTTALNLTNVGYSLLTNDSVRINWTNPGATNYNRTHLWLNGTLMGNVSILTTYYNLISLNPDSGYVVVLMPFDDYGNYGENETVLFTTFPNNLTGGYNTTFSVLGSEYQINLTFLQRPYFYSFNLSANSSNTRVYDTQENAYNWTASVDPISGGLWSQSNDGDWATRTDIDNSYAGNTFELYQNFTNYANYTNRRIYLNYFARWRAGSVYAYCLNADKTDWAYLGGYYASTGGYVDYNLTHQINSTCLEDDTIRIKYLITNNYGSGDLLFYETRIYSESPVYIRFEGDTIYNSTGEANNDSFYDLTDEANDNTDENITIIFGAMYKNTFLINYSYALVYNKTINISVYENNTINILNPTCTYNENLFYPKTELLYYNSSEENFLICNLTFYIGFSSYIYPTADAFNFSMTAENRTLILIDERTGMGFDVLNLSSVILYYEDNRTAFDFKSNSTNTLNFSALDSYKTRLELKYASGSIVTRYINLGMIDDTEIRICANVEGVTHYEQIVTSIEERQVLFKNVYSNCYVAADYTRFGYESSKALKAYTIDSLYYLYSENQEGNIILLTSLDGSIQTEINLDILLYQTEIQIPSIKSDALVAEKIEEGVIRIYYIDSANDNTEAQLTITDSSTSTSYLDTSDFSNPNNITYLFYPFAVGLTNTSNIKITLVTTDADGEHEEILYMSAQAQPKIFNSKLAVMISIAFLFFGFTIASTENTFSYFGVIMLLISIGILAFAQMEWYILFLLAIEIIILIWVVFIITQKTPENMT